MDDKLEKLQTLGAQKIYETTHIPVEHIQALLHNSFESFSRVQFLGFVSILEREYHLDLTQLRESGLFYFNDKSDLLYTDTKVFVASNKKKKKSLLYISIASAIFFIALLYSFEVFSDGSKVQEHVVDDSMIKSIQQSIDADSNESVYDINATDIEEDANETTAQVAEEQVVEKSFKINAKSNVWMGYIDFQTNKKYQKTFTGEIDLDPNTDWLLFFGHGYIDMYVNDELKKFNSRNNVRFLYKDGELETITAEEFKILNRGSKW